MAIKRNYGEKHHNWKGENAKYTAKHMWVYSKLGKASKCVNCKTLTGKRFEWANISGEYKRDVEDWVELCSACHREIDGNNERLVKFNQENPRFYNRWVGEWRLRPLV